MSQVIRWVSNKFYRECGSIWQTTISKVVKNFFIPQSQKVFIKLKFNGELKQKHSNSFGWLLKTKLIVLILNLKAWT